MNKSTKEAICINGTTNHPTVNLAKVLFVCVEVLRPSQPNGVMSSMVSLTYHTFTGQA